VAVESVLDDDAPEPQRSLSDILHNPSELQRFKSQFSAFFDSLYTTKTVTTTVTTLHHAGPGAHALMGSSIPAAFPPSSTTTFSAFPAMSHHFPHAMIGAAQYYQQQPQLGPASSEDYSPSSLSMSASSSFDSSSPDSNPLDPATTSSSSSSSSSTLSSMSSSTQAWSNITLAELLEDDECRAILQEQKRKAAESHQLQLQQQQQLNQQRVNLTSGSGGGSGKSLADQSLEELLDEFVPRTAQPS
jgi:hypothetical protein